MSVTIRVLRPAVTGEQRCHFLVQWRERHAIQHGRTFTTWQEAAGFDAAIKAGKPGDRLPSIVDLAATYEVALTTVRKALDALKEGGLVVTSPMGTFVAERPRRRS